MSLVKKILFKIHILKHKYCKIHAFYYRAIFSECGDNLEIWGRFNVKNPKNIKIGNNVSINDGVYINGLGGIVVGNNVSISAHSMILSTTLDADYLAKKCHINEPVSIGDNVQIGAGSIILPGLRIGSNVMIGAGSIVTKNVESNSIVVGNPAKVIRKLEER